MNSSNNSQTKTTVLLSENKPLTVLILILITGVSFTGQVGSVFILIVFIVYHLRRKTTLAKLGLSKPRTWTKTVLLSIGATILIMTLILVLLNPVISEFLPLEGKDVSRFDALKGNFWMLCAAVGGAWLLAGFGEELIWRGYVMTTIAVLFGNKASSWIISLLLTSTIFGLLHFYQGPVGMIQTGVAGLFFGMIFMINGKRNLWTNIFTHGLIDTISLTAIYLELI